MVEEEVGIHEGFKGLLRCFLFSHNYLNQLLNYIEIIYPLNHVIFQLEKGLEENNAYYLIFVIFSGKHA